MRSIKELKRSRDASTALMAIVIVAVLAVAAVGVYVFVLQDEEEKESVIQGNMGVGTTFEYEPATTGAPSYSNPQIKDTTMTIIGQSGEYYAMETVGEITVGYATYPFSFTVLMHKETSKIRYADNKGAAEGIDGAKKWNMVTDKREYTAAGEKDVDEVSIMIVSGMVDEKPLIHSFEIEEYGYAVKGVYVDDSMDLAEPEPYEPSAQIGKGWKYDLIVDDSETEMKGSMTVTIIADKPDGFIAVYSGGYSGSFDGTSVKMWARAVNVSLITDDLSTFDQSTVKLQTIDGNIDVTKYTLTKTTPYNTIVTTYYIGDDDLLYEMSQSYTDIGEDEPNSTTKCVLTKRF
jgi:hypothetical protein